MGQIPLPRALSKEEFDRRIAAGAKTMAEIDPALWKAHQQGVAYRRVASVILAVCGIVVMITFGICLFR